MENKPEQIGLICGKWRLPFYKALEDEEEKTYNARSFLHYVATNIAMIDAKARCTEWLMQGLPKVDEVMEFFGGVGLSSRIIREYLQPKTHWIGEYDKNCVEHLKNVFSADKVMVQQCDAFKAMNTKLEVEPGQKFAVFMDFPVFTCLKLKSNPHLACWANVLGSKPDIVGFADTSLARFWCHAKTYNKFFGGGVKRPPDYFREFSTWNYNEFGYSIAKTAFRAHKVTYSIMLKGKHPWEEKKFEEDNKGEGFCWLENWDYRGL